MKPAVQTFKLGLVLGTLTLTGCHNSPHVSTQELKSWSSNIDVRVQMLESNQARFNSSPFQPVNSPR